MKVFRPAVQVGEVAAPAAGDQDLLADTLRALQHGRAPPAPAGFDGAHQAGCPGAENDYVKTLHMKAASCAQNEAKYRLPKGREGTQSKRRTCVTICSPLRSSTYETQL